MRTQAATEFPLLTRLSSFLDLDSRRAQRSGARAQRSGNRTRNRNSKTGKENALVESDYEYDDEHEHGCAEHDEIRENRQSPNEGGRGKSNLALPPLLLVSVLILAGSAARAADAEREARTLSGRTMGTTYSVVLGGAVPTAAERRRLAAVVGAELARIDGLMSTYKPDSELSRFNRHAATDPFPVSPDTLEVFRIAGAMSELTGGAFDVTVAPLVGAWGFGATDRLPAPPAAAELTALRARVGYRLVDVDAQGGALRKRRAEVACDLSGIAKGYAVDRVARALRDIGRADALIEVGGDMFAGGRRGDGHPWRVAIERPGARGRSVQLVVALGDLALATSGDYRNYYESGGERLSHLIDPRRGRPIANGVASVSVAFADAARADALATGLSVLGVDDGLALAERGGIAAYFIVRDDGGGFHTRATPAFARLLAAADAPRGEEGR